MELSSVCFTIPRRGNSIFSKERVWFDQGRFQGDRKEMFSRGFTEKIKLKVFPL